MAPPDDHAAEDHIDKGAFGEILVEPACPHDRPFEAGRDHDPLAGLGFLLAAAGQDGVERALTILKEEIERAMRLMGITCVQQLNRDRLRFR